MHCSRMLEFGGANTLFAADERSGRIYAFELEQVPDETGNLDSVPYNLVGFGSKLAVYLDASPLSIRYHDLAVHPVTKAAFLSVSVNSGDSQRTEIVRVAPDWCNLSRTDRQARSRAA